MGSDRKVKLQAEKTYDHIHSVTSLDDNTNIKHSFTVTENHCCNVGSTIYNQYLISPLAKS